MADDEFTCDLFRFLQLLCEGHNNGESLYQTHRWLKSDLPARRVLPQRQWTTVVLLRVINRSYCYYLWNYGFQLLKTQFKMRRFLFSDFQNYLRTQTGSTTTINVIICTVDYLLRLQVTLILVPLTPDSSLLSMCTDFARFCCFVLFCLFIFYLGQFDSKIEFKCNIICSSSSFLHTGIDQWLLLVLLGKRHYRWAW